MKLFVLLAALAALTLTGCETLKTPPVVNHLTETALIQIGYGCQMRADDRAALELDVGWVLDVACSLVVPYYRPVPDDWAAEGAQILQSTLALMCEQPEFYEQDMGAALNAGVRLLCSLPGVMAESHDGAGGVLTIQ